MNEDMKRKTESFAEHYTEYTLSNLHKYRIIQWYAPHSER